MMLEILDRAGVFVVAFSSSVPIPLVVLQEYMKAAFPGVSTLNVVYTCEDGPYPLEPKSEMKTAALSVTVEQLGPRNKPDDRMNRSRNGSSSSSPSSSPSSPVTSRPASPAMSTSRSNLQRSITNIRDGGLQSALRDCCLRRDQFCVISGETDEALLKCCHVLTIEYAREFLAGFSVVSAPLARVPTVAGRYQREMDVRCAILMNSNLHELYDNFRFSILPKEGELIVWCFRPCAQLETGTIVQRPREIPVGYDRTYFQRQFPADELFMEHFKQSVLRNMVAAGEEDDDQFEHDGESAVVGEAGDLRRSLSTLTECLLPEEGDSEDVFVAKLHRLDDLEEISHIII